MEAPEVECREYPLGFVIAQNLFLLLYFGMGFVGMLSLRLSGVPVFSVAYAVFLGLMLLVVLRKHLCTHCCYYGKRCATGWGKLSALMFERGSGSYELGVKLAKITWALATAVPVLGISAAYFLTPSRHILALLLLFLLLTPINFALHRSACEKCGMRRKCPMTMAR